MATKRPVGQPTKYKPEYCHELLEHMSKGYSFESFAGSVGVCKDTIYQWVEVHPEFSESKKIATAKSMIWWEKQGIEGLYSTTVNDKEAKTSISKSINPTIWRMNMINRFKWKDKAEEDKKVDVNWAKLTDEELEDIVMAEAKQIEDKKKK